ncbi:uroporphyrinogen decarboxylase family protein [Acetobacterium sp.]|uniref:uroporphyrinogen decarboxylase family protein n=1 Tax=Acetobacterium sp. TaxID=1872094 RepID=UPI003592F5F7
MKTVMSSMERVLTAMANQEPDRVPQLLLFSLYGARELEMSVKDYFMDVDLVVNTQLMLQKKYHNDCLYTFTYAAIETEAFGGEVLFVDDEPPNAGAPLITSLEGIPSLTLPDLGTSPGLLRILELTRRLKQAAGDSIPIIGVVMSPFSLPIMQLGFEKYLELIYFRPKLFNQLMALNSVFCVNWANAQLAAGATAICYFNPLASPTIIEKATYLKTGYACDCQTLAKIKGPTATHLASGIVLPVLDEIINSKTALLGFGQGDDAPVLKARSRNRIALAGNLNGIEMVNWSLEKTRITVKTLIRQAGVGGGLLISDSHGEIPYQVPSDVLATIAETVGEWGQYPLEWIGADQDAS